MNRILHVTFGLIVLSAALFDAELKAASVTLSGYTNGFGSQPPASDWSTYTIAGTATDFGNASQMDAAVQNISASSVNSQLVSDANNPPNAGSLGNWSSTGFYWQTRPTSVAAIAVMCTLVNNIGGDASAVTLSYDFAQVSPLTEEIDGHRVYYSLTGAAGSWTPIPSLCSAAPGHLSATVNLAWPASGNLYILWVDDNSLPSSPDTAMQIDNFFAFATPANQVPVAITNSPQSRTVAELTSTTFTVGASGIPFPTFQWYTNDVAILNATNSSYTISSVPLHYNGLGFKVIAQNVVTNITYMATSSVAVLTVNADTNAPTLVRALSSGGNQVQVSFSEPITPATATNLANYVITNFSGTLGITNAVLLSDQTNVVLYTLPQMIGSNYTLTVNGIRDVSAAGNQIAANSQINFTAFDYSSVDIGSSGLPGSLTIISNTAFNVTGAGSDFGGTSDQFTMAYQQKSGDFDVKVRVNTLGFSDPWAKAALMARETLDSNSVFAAAVATPLIVGSFFESRTTTGAAATTAGTFPANYPDSWLRLKRVGNVFTGYAGPDGQTWVSLGSATLPIGTVYIGFAVTSHKTTQTTTAQFREYMDTDTNTATVVSSMAFSTEPLNAATRMGPIVISEIMYKPASSNANLEFVELYNSNPFYEDISGYRLSGDIDFKFPSNTVMQGGTFLVIAKDPAALQIAYGITGVLGPYSNSLPAEGTIRLRSDTDAIMLEVNYSDDNPWPVGARGSGHSIVLTRASYGQNVPKSWSESDRIGGSPGSHEPLRTKTGQRAVVINEILAHTDLPLYDYIELYNYSTQPVDISGCYLSDDPSTNKFKIPNGTVLPARGFISFDETVLGFSLSKNGETILFRSADGARMLDAVQYEYQQNSIALGRYPDGAPEFYRMKARTPGTTNSEPLIDDIVINEIMYGPISEEADDQYVELYNKGTNPIDISGWRFTKGIDFKFPPNSIIPADGYVVVAKNRANLLAHYSALNGGNTYGDFDGKLSRDGERLALGKPDYTFATNAGVITTNASYIVVDEVTYGTGGRWGDWANQGGSSLELIDPRSNHRLAYNWGDSDETSKAPWTQFTFTGILDTGSTQASTPIDRVEATMLGEGECLLDDIDVRVVGNATNLVSNGTFESGSISPWQATGNHIGSSLELSGNTGTKSLHIRAGGNGDTGANTVRAPIIPNPTAGQTLSITGYVRWLRGWPEITLRIKGGYLEAYGRMQLPSNLGSPGARNSRALTNSAPAIYGVVHSPIVPQTGENVAVTAGVQDPDGVTNVILYYRIDSGSPPAFTPLTMRDDGTGGDAVAHDGIYTALIPAQASGTMVSFYVEATDTRNAVSQFPVNAIVQAADGQRRECLVRWGDPVPPISFVIYRLWMSQANVNSYINRPALSNQDVDGTLVVNNYRVIYNVLTHYSNSPYHQGQNSSPVTGSVHFDTHLPLDDKYLGTENFNKIHAPGNGAFDDTALQREQTAYWLARKIGMPYLYRRFVAMYVNGNRKGGNDRLMEDTQRPGGELVDEFFPDETIGRLYKLQPWFEFTNDFTALTGGATALFDNKRWCTMDPNRSTNSTTGPHKIARYRQNWLTRSADKTANDYSNVVALIEAANQPTTSPQYWQNLSGMIDVEQWAHIFAVEHACGNWDSVGNRNAQNMYGWKPDGGKWKLMIWDYNIVLGSSAGPDTVSDTAAPNPNTQLLPVGNLFQTQSDQDPVGMRNLNAYAPFRRAWWRAYKELTVGSNAPMANAVSIVNAKYAAFQASGINPLEPSSITNFINNARTAILSGIGKYDYNGTFAVTTPSIITASNLITIGGLANFDITEIDLNGIAWPITWTTFTNWTATIAISNNSPITVAAYDKQHNLIGSTNTVSVTYSIAAVPDPREFVVFNEIMYNPAPNAPNAEYIELYNTHSNFAFNVSGWRINGVDYTFPEGSYIAPRSFLVLVKDRVAFNLAYGASIAVFDQYSGSLQGNGETLTLLIPAATTNGVDVVIDKVRYENAPAWSTNANNSGSSLQLIDPSQDNSRVANWASAFIPAVYSAPISTPATPRDGWRFFSSSGSIGTGDGGGQMRLLVYLGEVGSALIDDLSIVDGTNAAVGYNYVNNGDFESPLVTSGVTNAWNRGTNYTNSVIVGDLVHAGSGAFKIVGAAPGNANAPTYNRAIYQWLSPAPALNSINTMSFWYWATNSATNLLIRVRNSSALTTGNSGTNINIFFTPSNYVPSMLISAATNSASPGSNNLLTATLPAFQPLWINEVQAENLTGITDNHGEHDPWVEIYNGSTNTVLLEGLYLSSGYTNLTNWAFPVGSSIGPTQFLVVFCDGQPAQTSNTEYHTSFRLTPGNGTIALSRTETNLPASLQNLTNRLPVLDYINYANLHGDRSYGSFPDGQPFDRQEFFFVTPGRTNNGSAAPLIVFINEWMAQNTTALADPADGDFDDWFELYNPGTNIVDLAGYYLTDTLTNKFKYLITTNGPHTIAPHGFLLVWADNETGQNTSGGQPRADRHVNFQLSATGEAIGLYAADGTQIDAVTFNQQTNDVSMGRYPDGGPNIYFMTNPTPRLPNFFAQSGNTAPVLDLIGDKIMYLGQTLSFTATATDADVPAQVLTFSLDPVVPSGASISGAGSFSFTPLGTGTNFVTVRVTDSGVPAASDFETFKVQVLDLPSFSKSLLNGNYLELTWGTVANKTYAIDYKSDLNAAQWTPLWTNTAGGGSLTFTNAITNSTQGFFRIRTVD